MGGVIVNADSAQIYRDLPVLSAAPTLDERSRADHRLFGTRDGADPCSAAEWAQMARQEIDMIHQQGGIPILVGGTGLYLRALLEGIAPIPPIDPAIRRQVRAASVQENSIILKDLDAGAAARINPGDTTRVNRALEVILSTGRPLKEWQEKREGGVASLVQLRAIILLPPREWLYERCDERFRTMIDEGAIEEVRILQRRLLSPELPVMRAIGVREIIDFLAGNSSLDEAIAAGQQATRRYAKRQFTWFQNQPPKTWPRFTEPLLEARTGDAIELLQQQPE